MCRLRRSTVKVSSEHAMACQTHRLSLSVQLAPCQWRQRCLARVMGQAPGCNADGVGLDSACWQWMPLGVRIVLDSWSAWSFFSLLPGCAHVRCDCNFERCTILQLRADVPAQTFSLSLSLSPSRGLCVSCTERMSEHLSTHGPGRGVNMR